eukprot:GHVR01157028.1.p1 GENE.GHVR01157028.1~~GHVR01157028.1.p1  ORF type:complete len:218 (-),score=42.32 GHVR01157028.1:529-1182(-)
MKILISLLFGFIIKIFSNGLSGTWTVSDWLNSDVDTTALKGRILAVGDFSSRKKPDIVCASRVGISDSRQLNSVDNRQFESIDAYDISSVDASDISDTSDASSTGGGKVGTSVFFGLGRTNNYIEYFFLGSPGGQTKHWVSVIPNTDIVAIPYPPSNPDDWTVELSLSPSRHFYRIVVMTTLLLSVLGLIIFCLDRKEKLAEEKIQHDTFRVHYISA